MNKMEIEGGAVNPAERERWAFNKMAMDLLNKIQGEFTVVDFSFADIKDSFNSLTAQDKKTTRLKKDTTPEYGNKFTQEHLQYLVDEGYLEFNDETNQYRLLPLRNSDPFSNIPDPYQEEDDTIE